MTLGLCVIILAAGQGSRMRSSLPKILHTIGSKSMISHVIDTALELSPDQIILVVSPSLDQSLIEGKCALDFAIQSAPLGTGDAVRSAVHLIKPHIRDILILCGDVPLVRSSDLKALLCTLAPLDPSDLSDLSDPPHSQTLRILAMDLPAGSWREYGRLCVDGQFVNRIIEHKDLDSSQQTLSLCNAGIYVIPSAILNEVLSKLDANNKAHEYYLTDVVKHAKSIGIQTTYFLSDEPLTLQGINTPEELASVSAYLEAMCV